MKKDEKNKGGIIALLLILFLICLGAGVYGYLYKDKNEIDNKVTENKKVDNNIEDNKKEEDSKTIENKTTISGFDKVEVTDLSDKLSKLDFSTKTKSSSNEEEWLKISATIVDGNVEIKISITEGEETIERTYIAEDINNAISVGTGIGVEGNGYADFYILTNDGKVYHIEDEISDVKKEINYMGVPKDMLISDAISIAVVDENFNLSNTAEATIPTVYIKTSDGRVFTDEPINEQQGLIEVLEK